MESGRVHRDHRQLHQRGARLFGLPVKNYLTEMGPDGHERALPREKFYIPGSLLKVNVDNTNPLAYGMPNQVDVFFDNSPVFRWSPTAELKKTVAGGLVLREPRCSIADGPGASSIWMAAPPSRRPRWAKAKWCCSDRK